MSLLKFNVQFISNKLILSIIISKDHDEVANTTKDEVREVITKAFANEEAYIIEDKNHRKSSIHVSSHGRKNVYLLLNHNGSIILSKLVLCANETVVKTEFNC